MKKNNCLALVFSLNIILIIVQVTISWSRSTQGIVLDSVSKEYERITLENQELKNAYLRLGSLAYVQEQSKYLGLVPSVPKVLPVPNLASSQQQR